MAGLNDFFLFLFWTHLRWEMHIIRKATATQNEPTSFLGWQFYDFHIYVVWNFFYYISKSIVQIDLLYSLPNNCLEGHLEKKFWKNNLQKYGLERQAVHFSIVTIWLRTAPRGPMAAPLEVLGVTPLEVPGGQTLRPRFSSSGDF